MMSKWSCAALSVLFLLLLIAPAAAQDVTPTETPAPTLTPTDPPTPPPTLTETPTATATHTETAAATLTETAAPTALTETPTATFETTASPSATWIETPTETATSDLVTASPSPSATLTETATQPAFPPEPPLTELFTDNFDSGALYLWTLGAGWALVPSEGVAGGQALQVTGSDEAVTFVHHTLTDVAVQARFQFETGMARLNVRENGTDSYNLRLSVTGDVGLYRGDLLLGAAVVSPNTPGGWRTVRLSAIGDLVRVAIDGVEVIVAQDAAMLPQGTISFGGVGAGVLMVDDVALSISNIELALLSAATATPDYSLPPTPTPDAAYENNINLLNSQSVTALAGNTIFRNVSNAAELKTEILAANANLADTYVIYLNAGAYTFDSLWASGTSTLLSITGTIILVGIESYNLDIPPFDPGLPNGDKVIIQRSDSAPQVTLLTNYGNLTLYNVIIRNGGGPGSGATPPIAYGAGIVNKQTLNIYNSLVADNTSHIAGAGILNDETTAQLTVINTVFSNNKTLNRIFSNAGGGGIANTLGTMSNSECITFELNDVRDGGGIFNGLFGDGGTVTLQKSNFLNNLAVRAKAIFGFSGTVTLTGIVHWEPTAEANTTHFGGAISPAPSSIVNTALVPLNCSIPPIPRHVLAEAQEFHDKAARFGLPMSFTRLPLDELVYQNGVLTDMQGLGPTTFAVGDPNNQYDGTHGIHDGIDYMGDVDWANEDVEALCDGIIIEGRNSQHGGSSSAGGGISLRCFAGDTDHNGQRNLSNVVVVYNHLKSRVYQPPQNPPPTHPYQIVTRGTRLGGTTHYYTGCLTGTTCTISNLNTECIPIENCIEIFDHMHFQMYLARGYENNSEAIMINPLLMFDFNTANIQLPLISERPYFPINYTGDPKGITEGLLNEWSQRGGLPDTDPGSNSFYGIQTPIPVGTVEWKAQAWDRERLLSLSLVQVLENYYRYSTINTYIGPNCTNVLMVQPLPTTCLIDNDDAHLSPILP